MHIGIACRLVAQDGHQAGKSLVQGIPFGAQRFGSAALLIQLLAELFLILLGLAKVSPQAADQVSSLRHLFRLFHVAHSHHRGNHQHQNQKNRHQCKELFHTLVLPGA